MKALKLDSKSCAAQIVETIPTIMRLLRAGVRNSDMNLSVSQLRLLAYLDRNPGASVSAVSEELEVTLATASALVDRLVRRELVKREEDPLERRRMLLELTNQGRQSLHLTREKVQHFITHILNGIPSEHLLQISQALTFLAQAAKTFGDQKNNTPFIYQSQ